MDRDQLHQIVRSHREKLAREFGVKSLALSGSLAGGQAWAGATIRPYHPDTSTGLSCSGLQVVFRLGEVIAVLGTADHRGGSSQHSLMKLITFFAARTERARHCHCPERDGSRSRTAANKSA